MAEAPQKSDQAFKTIGELADELGLPQHILRYWETRFPQLRPLQRAGNRRYYRPADVALAHRIHHLLNQEGYTIRGVQQVLASRGGGSEGAAAPVATAPVAEPSSGSQRGSGIPAGALRTLRQQLADALANSAS
jgi:DNA-binding transcriptional MerR regulator